MNLDPVRDIVRRRVGLEARTVGQRFVDTAIEKEMKLRGLDDAKEYEHLLLRSKEALDALTEAVLVPETWWFRDGEAFVDLASRSLSLGSKGVRRCKILSLPCSTGEEPYSAAIEMLEHGMHQNLFNIDAVDIGDRVLDIARKGSYRDGSMRNISKERLAKWFTRSGNHWTIVQIAHERVRFRKGNILDETTLPTGPYDAVFCRNLLIYFDDETRKKALKVLLGLLSQSGVLYTGPAESYYMIQQGMVPVEQVRSFGFLRDPKPPTPHAIPRREEKRIAPPKKHPHPVKLPSIPRKDVASPPPATKPGDVLLNARNLANSGKLGDALSLCEKELREKAPSSQICCLCGVIKDAMGAKEAAESFYRMAIYLDPEHSESLWHLSSLCRSQNRSAEASLLEARARAAQRKDSGNVG